MPLNCPPYAIAGVLAPHPVIRWTAGLRACREQTTTPRDRTYESGSSTSVDSALSRWESDLICKMSGHQLIPISPPQVHIEAVAAALGPSCATRLGPRQPRNLTTA